MSNVEALLHRLDKVRTSGNGKWMACCPAHQDRNPSLGIKLLDDGKILINCLSGCSPGDVMAAIGLSLKDLFPDGPISHHSNGMPAWKIKKYQEALEHEQRVWGLSRADIAKGKLLSPEDMKRAKKAASRIFQITEVLSHD